MHGGRWWGGVVGLVMWMGAQAATGVPPALEPWRDWALYGHDDCPLQSDGESTACAWPGELQIEAGADGARFTQRWTAYARLALPLPGDDAEHRPLAVTLDGAPAPVAFDEAGPVVWVEPGSHVLAGRIAWSARPPTLALPENVAWVSLRVDGVAVAVPQRDDSGQLVLGATDAAEGDALQLEAYRLLADGTPPWLATRVELSVTGKPREQLLGPILPAGFTPVAIDGEIPARWEADGRLRLQVRPGQWSVTVIARAPATAVDFSMPVVPAPWAEQEIWQFRAAPEFRVAQLEGVPGIDPTQANVPDWSDGLSEDTQARWEWMLAGNSLPTFVMDASAHATLTARLRGLPSERPPRLTLSRELWLNFEGSQWLARDSIDGQPGSAQRFDMQAPWTLEQASRSDEQNLLVTQGPAPASTGFEWRDAAVSVRTGARAARAASLPASGWSMPFEGASASLHLPPGYRLFGASGVDQAADSWVARWTLLDLFLASMLVLLAWRLRDPVIAAALLGWLLWAWHEPDAPRLTLLLVIGLVLLLRYLPAGRWQRGIAWTQRGALALVALWSLSFAATQLELAIFPQLEHDAVDVRSYDSGIGNGFLFDANQSSIGPAMQDMAAPVVAMESAAPPPPPPAPSQRMRESKALEAIVVAGSRMKPKPVVVYKYPTDTIPQAGRARPDWQWHVHALSWNGPLLPDETLHLWISPPWLTRSLRVASVLLLALALARLARRAWSSMPALRPRDGADDARADASPGRALGAVRTAIAVLGLGLCTATSMPAHSQALPDQALLDALRDRLLEERSRCAGCVSLGELTVTPRDGRIVLAFEAHATQSLAYPLPWPSEAPVLAALRVDGAPAQPRLEDDGAWIVLERGVHRVEAEFASGEGRWRFEFPLLPARIAAIDAALEVSGIDDGQLIGNTLELSLAQTQAGEEAGAADLGQAIPPFVRVRRHLNIDQQWRLETWVQRIAPERGGLTVPVTLLSGELPLENAPPVREGIATVSIPAGQDEVHWVSRLTPGAQYALLATDAAGYSEEWLLDAAPLWHVQARGLPESETQSPGTHRYLPLPGESLELAITRPAAIDGESLVIEQARLQVAPGQRARDARLELSLRSTRAGQHWLALPPDSELLGVNVDGVEQPRVLDAGRVAIALRAQPQSVLVWWREPIATALAMRTPALELGADAGNLRLALQLPPDRWLLATHGPGVGPALLYWPQLALLVLVAWGLSRFKLAPLRFHHWLLLGLGFSTVSWIAGGIVAAWLLSLGWRARLPAGERRLGFSLLQAGLVFATFVALLCLVAAVPTGLLGSPDMQVVGNGSYGSLLNWYVDDSDGTLPAATVWSLPLWAYKAAILAWALWLANALIGWLRWGWGAFSAGGRWYWPKRKESPAPVAPA